VKLKVVSRILDIDAIYNLKFRKTDSFATKLNAKFTWSPIMPKQHECILQLKFESSKQYDICCQPRQNSSNLKIVNFHLKGAK
jgi:hypothetical protein